MYNSRMQAISVSDFRQKCLALMDELPAEGLLITRHGRPVAQLLPVRPSNLDLIGSIPELIASPEDDLFSTGEKWDAES